MVRGQGWKRRLLPEGQYLECLPDLFGPIGFDTINLVSPIQHNLQICDILVQRVLPKSENRFALMALGVGDTRQKLDLVVKRLHVLGAPKVGCVKVRLLD